jgi:hypothetical protein
VAAAFAHLLLSFDMSSLTAQAHAHTTFFQREKKQIVGVVGGRRTGKKKRGVDDVRGADRGGGGCECGNNDNGREVRVWGV